MISLIFLVSALVLGVAVTLRLGLRLTAFEAPALSVVLGLVLWTWLSFLLALVLPYAACLPLTVILAAAASWWLWRRQPGFRWLTVPGGKPAWTAWTVFTAFSGLLFATLMWSHDLPTAPDGSIYSANATWADFGLHASLISHFAASSRLPLDFPVAAGAHLTYPFMVDLLSGWLVYGGWSLHAAIFIPSILLILAALQLLIGFGLRLFGRIGGSLLGLTLVLFSGSAVGLFTAYQDFAASHLSPGAFLNHLPKDYTALSLPNAQVTNFVADLMLPQRAFLMGIGLFAAILILMTALRQRPTLRLALFTGALIGLLPLIHAHTFVIAGLLVAGFWAQNSYHDRKIYNIWLVVGGVALLVALPQILWQALANGTGTGGHLALGWTINPGENLISFWLHNYGLMGLLIAAIGLTLACDRKLRRFAVWYVPLLVLFVAANIYSLQPFTYDNLKLIMYVYLFADIFAGYGIIWLIRRQRLAIIPAALVIILLCGSGLLAVLREYQHQDQFASPDDVALAAWVSTTTSPNDVFLTTDRPNQPVAALAGRSIVAGYRGWLYNYNLDYQPRLAVMAEALQGQLTSPAPYHAKYLAVSTTEPAEWSVNRPAMAAAYHQVYSNPSWTVYRLP